MFNDITRKINNNLLVFGYIRLNYKQYICYAIKCLCQEYFNKIINFKVTKAKFKKCKHIFKEELINTPEIIIFGNELIFYIENNNYSEYDLYVWIKNTNAITFTKIKQINLYFEFFCNDFKLYKNGCFNIDVNPVKQYSNIDSYIASFPKKLLNQFMQNDFLRLSIYLDVLCIKYSDNESRKYNFNKCKINPIINFEWTINYELYEELKEWNNGNTKFFSNNFGFNDDALSSFTFCLGIKPANSELSLECIALPNNIQKVICTVHLLHDTYIRISNYTVYNTMWWEEIYINYSLKKKFKSIKFKVNIIINEVYNYYGKKIEKSEWNDCNIYEYNKTSQNDTNTNDKYMINYSINKNIINNYFSNNKLDFIQSTLLKNKKNDNYKKYYPQQNKRMRYYNSKIFHNQ